MSIEITGNNSYAEVPLIDMTAGSWIEGANQCSPLFRNVAISGLSALCHGIRQAPDERVRLDAVEFGDVFDHSGAFINNELYRKIDGGWYPKPPYVDHFAAGVHVVRAAFTASRLFSAPNVINDDYTGQTGVDFVRRRVEIPVANSRAAGEIINSYPVRNIQAQLFAEPKPVSEYSSIGLDFAAGLYGSGSLPQSTTISLATTINTQQRTTKAQITSASRRGDFAQSAYYTDFQDLSRYAKVVDANL